jgi:hypothetical protein
MFKSHLAIAVVAASALLIGSQAFAQQKQAAPAGQTTAQAGQAESCGGALDKANNNIALRIQGDGQISRETARVHLYKAGQYLAAGNEAQCWQELGISKQIVR